MLRTALETNEYSRPAIATSRDTGGLVQHSTYSRMSALGLLLKDKLQQLLSSCCGSFGPACIVAAHPESLSNKTGAATAAEPAGKVAGSAAPAAASTYRVTVKTTIDSYTCTSVGAGSAGPPSLAIAHKDSAMNTGHGAVAVQCLKEQCNWLKRLADTLNCSGRSSTADITTTAGQHDGTEEPPQQHQKPGSIIRRASYARQSSIALLARIVSSPFANMGFTSWHRSAIEDELAADSPAAVPVVPVSAVQQEQNSQLAWQHHHTDVAAGVITVTATGVANAADAVAQAPVLASAAAKCRFFSMKSFASQKGFMDMSGTAFSGLSFPSNSLIGQGAFGQVHRATYNGVHPVAVKMLMDADLQSVNARTLRSFQDELKIMQQLQHPNIVHCYGGNLEGPSPYIITELCRCSLDKTIADHKQKHGTGLPQYTTLVIGLQVASALAYMHPNIVHRDLKPHNVLLDMQGAAKVADFGLSRMKSHKYTSTGSITKGTAAYLAPECFLCQELSEKVDVYSLGVLLCECLTGEQPWRGCDLARVVCQVCDDVIFIDTIDPGQVIIMQCPYVAAG
eukprot:GHRR01023219.1.p1 GENE.GHRR01023219.1~~GHRR01023219.1.p1  ORF type:complete len:566 (+),score=137.25 GHRR01023219.1:405-2102(+)